MRTLTYYAATLDGYIADPGGEFDFFPFEGGLRRPSSPSTRRPCRSMHEDPSG